MRIDLSATALVLALLTAPLTALAQNQPPVIFTDGEGSSPSLVIYRPEPAVACDDQGLARLEGQDLPPMFMGQAFGPQGGQRVLRASLNFAIDALGRPRDIRPTTSGSDADGPLTLLSGSTGEAAQATLAGWRFAPGARSDCRLVIRYTSVRVDQADEGLLLEAFAVTRTSGDIRRAVQNRLSGAPSPCGPETRRQRLGHPDFDTGPRRPGFEDWTVVRWNIDSDGHFTDVETLGSSGDAAFDAQIRDSALRSQATPGPTSTGCVYNWYRRGGKLAAPPVPETPADPASQCPAAVLSTFKPRTSGQTPPSFAARGIEGWALIRFDIAPWGEVGNVAVIDAQPAAAFGTAAQALVASGRGDTGPGATRCVQPVFFRLPEAD